MKINIKNAHRNNYSRTARNTASIKYIVLHYTGNVNDTAKNNADYFVSTDIKTSAHYFVDDNEIWRSVPDNYSAYAVGLGSRTTPYVKWPSHWKKCKNSNSISIEMCGSKYNNEASEQTKNNAAALTAYLMEKYSIPFENIIRHFDVTGKSCPAWAVIYPSKWEDMLNRIRQAVRRDDPMLDTPENYAVFKKFMDRYKNEQDTKTTDGWSDAAMAECEEKGIIKGGRPCSTVTRGELATVVTRLK